ncbi:MAG: exonuclease domain-containing protein [Sarcina sp.]
MSYVIFDLEFNQSSLTKEERKSTNNKLLFEIIQIGAVKIDKELKVISTFNSLIKPTVHKELHPYVEKLTNININDLNNSDEFSIVFKDFLEFISDDTVAFGTWGTSDIKELIKNINYHNLNIKKVPLEYIDIQRETSLYFNYNKGKKIGLQTAVENLNILMVGDYHNAFFDALFTYEVFKKIFNSAFKTEKYNLNKVKRLKSKKKNLDTEALFKQFEKIYNRPLSIEEKNIIKLAYIMGKTNQFLK